jgi:predicted MPP superfamily phosphohydrolase
MGNQRASGLFAPRRRRHYGRLSLALLLLSAAALVLSLNGLSNRFVRLQTRRVTILQLPKELEGFNILHLSDLNAANLGKDQENLRKALGKESYQAVVLTGDMMGKSGNTQPLLDILGFLPDEVPVFFIAGDSDPEPLVTKAHGDSEVKAPYIREIEAAGAMYLEVPYKLEVEGKSIWFLPGELLMYDLPNAQFALNEQVKALQAAENPYDPETGAQLRSAAYRLSVFTSAIELLTQIQPEDVVVAIMHHPPSVDFLNELSASGQDNGVPQPSLFLAGQYNNGQIRLPGLGPLFIPLQADGRGGFLPGDEGFSGLSITKGFPVYISPGLGVSGYYPLPLRLFNRPGATLVQLTQQMTR